MKDEQFERYDMSRRVGPCKWFLKPLLWALSFPSTWMHGTKIVKDDRLKGLKPPYILLSNHNAFFDMKVALRACFPYVPNFIVAIDGFIGREGLLRNIGCICKRKFTSDIRMIKHIRNTVQDNGIVGLYPEARYSLCGTTAVLPASLGYLCKRIGVPVVTLICHGHHINHPFWNTRKERGVKPTSAEMKLLLSEDELKSLSGDEINRMIVNAFQYDDFKWQKDNGIRVRYKDRAVGLEKILYQCPDCGKEFAMTSDGDILRCSNCNASWRMTEFGELVRESGAGELTFSHIPDWYEWERGNVRNEVRNGVYSSGKLPVHVRSLPNAKKFIDIGSGYLTHDKEGFRVSVTDSDGDVHELIIPAQSTYSLHIEYEYLFKFGDCVDLNTLTDTWYVYPEGKDYAVTKMALATEEIYYHIRESNNDPCPPGLA